MAELEWIKAFGDVGGIGLAALMVVVIWRVVVMGLGLFKEEVIPLVTNHLRHVEDAFDNLTDSHKKLIETQERIITRLDRE